MKRLLKWKVDLSNCLFFIYPLLVIVLVGIFLYSVPFQIVPDYFSISKYTKIYETFNLIISSLVSLIGIYVSVSLIAFEFFKQRSGIDFGKALLLNRKNAYFVSTAVSVILFSFCCSILIPSTQLNNHQVTIVYYNFFLFMLIIVLLFPIAFNLFSSLRPERLANDELQKINNKSIYVSVSENNDIDEQAEILENDHLLRVETIIFSLISVSENIKAQALIQKVTLRLCDLIIEEENKQDKEYIVKRLISFYIKVIDLVTEKPNSGVILRSIWISISRMYEVLIERKESAIHYEKFREEFFSRYFNRLFDSNNEEVIFEGISTIKHIIQNQVVKNMANDKEIYSFNGYRSTFEKDFKYPKEYTSNDYKKNEHWNEIAVEMKSFFKFLINKGITLNKPDLLNKCFQELEDLNFKFNLKGIGIYKQTYFYIHTINVTCDYTFRAFEKNVFIEGHDAHHILPALFKELIQDRHLASRTVLQKYCNLLINLQKINKLDRWFLGGLTIGNFITTQGDLGEIAKQCAINFNNGKETQDCLDDCIETYKILKEYFEANPPQNLGLYHVIKWQLNNILEWLEKEQINADKEINILKNLIQSFKSDL